MTRKQLSLELGTGFYLCKINEILDEQIVPKEAFRINGAEYKSVSNPSQKECSTIFVNKMFNVFELPYLLKAGKIQEIIQNTSIGHLNKEQQVEDYIQIHYYKQHLLASTDIFIDEDTLCSNQQIVTRSNEGFSSFDLFHVYLILILHIKYCLFRKHQVDILNGDYQTIIGEIKYSLPICAIKVHIDFMDKVINTVFPKMPTLQVTEPEAGFAYLTKELDLLDLELQKECIVIDAGEGTIDCIRLQHQLQSEQQKTCVWRLMEKQMFLCGGARIRESFIKLVKQRVKFEGFDKSTAEHQFEIVSHKFYEQHIQKIKFDENLRSEKTEARIFTEFIPILRMQIVNLFDFEPKKQNPDTLEQIFANERLDKPQKQSQEIMKNYFVYFKEGIIQQLNVAYDEIFANINKFLQADLRSKYGQAQQVIFIGGLANSSLMCKKLKQFCVQNKYDFLNEHQKIANNTQIKPQMLIFQGIPYESQTVTTRNLNEIAPYNLFALGSGDARNKKTEMLQLKLNNKNVAVRRIQKVGGDLEYAPIKIISKGEKLYWSQDQHKILQQEVHSDFKIHLVKTNGSNPPFLNFRDAESIPILQQAFDIFSIDIKLPKAEINEKFGTSFTEVDGIEIQVLINFDVLKFVTEPFIEIQIKDPNTDKYFVYQHLSIWDYYKKKCKQDVEFYVE